MSLEDCDSCHSIFEICVLCHVDAGSGKVGSTFYTADTSRKHVHLQTHARYHVVVIFQLLCDEFFEVPREVQLTRLVQPLSLVSRLRSSPKYGRTGRVSRQLCL